MRPGDDFVGKNKVGNANKERHHNLNVEKNHRLRNVMSSVDQGVFYQYEDMRNLIFQMWFLTLEIYRRA